MTSVTRLDHATFDWRTGAGGAAEVRRIAADVDADDGHEALNEQARLTLGNHGLDGAILLLAEGVDRAQGFAYVHGLSGPGRPELDLVVDPVARRRGVGSALLAEVVALTDGIPLTAWSHGDHPGAAALAAHTGFSAVRRLWRMARTGGPLPEPTFPVGVTVRGYRCDEDDDAFLDLNAAAFAHHPEQGGLTLAGLHERLREDWFDPAGFLLAVREDDGRLLGFHWTKNHGPDVGEVYVIGVSPDAQGSGLGRSLLVAGLRHLHDHDRDRVLLYVEGDNTGAIRLYESLGFSHEDTDVMYASLVD